MKFAVNRMKSEKGFFTTKFYSPNSEQGFLIAGVLIGILLGATATCLIGGLI